MEIQDFFNNNQDYNHCGSPKKRKYENTGDTHGEEFFSDILSPEELGFFENKIQEETMDEYQTNFFYDVIKQEDDPIFAFNNYMPPKIKLEKKEMEIKETPQIITSNYQLPNQMMIPNQTIQSNNVEISKMENTIANKLQATYTLDISPKTRVSNNPKDISITVTIKIPNLKEIKNFPDKILLWSSTKKLGDKITAICEDGVNEVQVDTSSCFVVLMNFDLRDKDDLFVSNCNEHLSKEKQGCQFAGFPGPCLFRHVAPLSISKKMIHTENSSVETLFLTRTFQNLKIDKKGHFCKSSKFKLNLNSQVVFPTSLQHLGLSCSQKLCTNVNYSKQIITDCYWVEKLMTTCHSAQLRFSSQRVFSVSINSPQLSEDLSKIISSFQHISEVDIRYVNPFVSSNFVNHLLTNLYDKTIHLKELTLYGSLDQWKTDTKCWNLIEKLYERYWDLKIHFFSSGSLFN